MTHYLDGTQPEMQSPTKSQLYVVKETSKRLPNIKEMTTILHCLRTWRNYLNGRQLIPNTKETQPDARWQDFLAEFDMW
ncbi:hypothetical protein AAC387_Pa11g0538 [Persea americana]